jgi:hypothetical protein
MARVAGDPVALSALGKSETLLSRTRQRKK